MSQAFFVDLGLPKPDYNLGVGSGSHGKQTGAMLKQVEEVLLDQEPDLVIVYGDTNSNPGGGTGCCQAQRPGGSRGGWPTEFQPEGARGDQPRLDGSCV